MRNTNIINNNPNNKTCNQQFELESEALVNLVNKLVNQIEERLKGI